jgi:hypothetical protein
MLFHMVRHVATRLAVSRGIEMRYVIAAAAMCVSTSVAATVTLPDLPVNKWVTLTFYGIGVVDVGADHPEKPAFFRGVEGQAVKVTARMRYFHYRVGGEEDFGYISDFALLTRIDNGLSWGAKAPELNDSRLYGHQLSMSAYYSWWGSAINLWYDFDGDRGKFDTGWYDGGTTTWEGRGRWFATKVTASVPEPTTWAMLLSGFGIIGITLRSSTRSRLA